MTRGYSILTSILLSQTVDWNIKQFFNTNTINSPYELKKIGSVLTRCKERMTVEDRREYKRITIKTNCGGVVVRDETLGEHIKTKTQYYIKTGQLAVSKIDARNGAFGIVPPEADGAIITGNFWVYDVDPEAANIKYLILLLASDVFVDAWQDCSNGSGNRLYLQENKFLDYPIPLPDIEVQNAIVNEYNAVIRKKEERLVTADKLRASREGYLYSSLGIKTREAIKHNGILHTVNYKSIQQWGYDKIGVSFPFEFVKYDAFSFSLRPGWIKEVYRGKSPKYDEYGKSIILNQKCNRWDEIDLKYAKKVNDEWIGRLDKSVFTRKNDILINSTGEGTLGRASLIRDSEHAGLIYDSHMLLLRVNTDELDPQLIVDIINSAYGQEQVNIYKSAQATKQTELGIENLKKIKFPLPDIDLQREIAAELNNKKIELNKLLDEIEELQKAAKEQFEKAVFT